MFVRFLFELLSFALTHRIYCFLFHKRLNYVPRWEALSFVYMMLDFYPSMFFFLQNIKLFGNSFAFFQMQHCIVCGFHCSEKDHTAAPLEIILWMKKFSLFLAASP